MINNNPDIREPNPLGEQMYAAFCDVERFEYSAELSDAHQRKVDRLLDEYRERHAFAPVVRGDDGKMRSPVGSPTARWISHRGSDDLPKYNPDNPHHTQVPMIVPAWNLDHEWAVRGESIEDVLGGFAFDAVKRPFCDWHRGLGALPDAAWVRAQGQIILLLHICGPCRNKLDRTYGGGLLFLELAEVDKNSGIRRVQIPTI